MAITPLGDRSGALAAFAVSTGPHAGKEVPIHAPVVGVGRSSKNEVVIDDDSVSPAHARVEYVDGVWRITDLKSTNGTYVEGVRLAPEVTTPLPPGSAVRFGGVGFHFHPVDEADPEGAVRVYTPQGEEKETVRAGGFRLPLWVLLLVVIVVALVAFFVFGWETTEPTGATPAAALPSLIVPGMDGA